MTNATTKKKCRTLHRWKSLWKRQWKFPLYCFRAFVGFGLVFVQQNYSFSIAHSRIHGFCTLCVFFLSIHFWLVILFFHVFICIHTVNFLLFLLNVSLFFCCVSFFHISRVTLEILCVGATNYNHMHTPETPKKKRREEIKRNKNKSNALIHSSEYIATHL